MLAHVGEVSVEITVFPVRPCLHDIGLLSMPNRFYESGMENVPEYEVYTKSCTGLWE